MFLSEGCIIKQPGEVTALWGTTLMRVFIFFYSREIHPICLPQTHTRIQAQSQT